MLPIIQIGPLAIQTQGIVLLLGLWIGMVFADRYAPQRGQNSNTLYNLVFISLISGLIGGRITYIFRYIDIFAKNPSNIFSINPDLFDPVGALVIGLIAGYIYSRKKKLDLLSTLDSLTPLLAVFAIAVAVSNLTSGVRYGVETDLPWAIEIWGANRHPTQIYEIISAVIILFIFWPSLKIWRTTYPGVYFLAYVSLTVSSILFLEAFQSNSATIFGGFRSVQIIAWFSLLISFWGIHRIRIVHKKDKKEE